LRGEVNVFDVVDRLGDKVAEDPKLVRDRGWLELHVVGEIGHGALGLPQPRQDANPARSGERLHRLGDLLSEIAVDRRER
jgi:hypothetical protein